MINKLNRCFKRAFIAIIRSRRLKASEEVARFLIANNSDFRRCSQADLTQQILKGNYTTKEISDSIA
jgi:hypothetical protein